MTRFALVGCGRIAERHVVQIARTGTLVAACDTDEARAAKLAGPLEANTYSHIDQMLEQEPQIDLVVVCSPNGLHAEHAIKSLQAGRHVLCEKPMCIASNAAHTLRDTAHFFRRHMFVVKQNRYNPPVLAVKQMLEQGALGRILSFSITGIWSRPQAYYTGGWQGTKELDGGILYTQFSHFIDLLLWLLGPVEVMGGMRKDSGLRQHFAIEDSYAGLLRTAAGATGTVHFSINSVDGNKEGSLTLVGESGTVKIGGQYLNTLEWQPNTSGINTPLPEGMPHNNYGFYTGSMSNHHRVYDELALALAGKPHSLPDARETVATVELIERMYAVTNPSA